VVAAILRDVPALVRDGLEPCVSVAKDATLLAILLLIEMIQVSMIDVGAMFLIVGSFNLGAFCLLAFSVRPGLAQRQALLRAEAGCADHVLGATAQFGLIADCRRQATCAHGLAVRQRRVGEAALSLELWEPRPARWCWRRTPRRTSERRT